MIWFVSLLYKVTAMKELILPADIKVYRLKATSFPGGVLQAHQQLHEKAAPGNRRFYGISHPWDGVIMYWAAATELYDGELEGKGLEPFVIVRGKYVYKDVHHFMQHPAAIGDAFSELLEDSRIAHDGCCVEEYMNEDDCRCMVRIQ